jgi:predicted DNA-binding protein YlxM (UPF0122 family)
MKDYMQFDVDGFFRDYKPNKRKLRDLEWDLAQACSQGGMDYAKPKVTGGLPTSQVEQAVERIADIRAKIADLSEYFERVDKFLNCLDATEKIVAEQYFIRGLRSRFAIEEIAHKAHISRASVYRTVRKIREKIRRYVERT